MESKKKVRCDSVKVVEKENSAPTMGATAAEAVGQQCLNELFNDDHHRSDNESNYYSDEEYDNDYEFESAYKQLQSLL